MKSITIKLVFNPSAQLFSDNTLSFDHFFFGDYESGRSLRGCNLGKLSTVNVQKTQTVRVRSFC